MADGGAQHRLDLPFTGFVSFLRSPTCADLDALDADVAIIGIPNDEGTGWLPGSRFGPRRLREASVRFTGGSLRFATGSLKDRSGFWDLDERHRYLEREMEERRIVDCGDVDILYTRPDSTWDNATKTVRTVLRRGALPVVLGGDHSITYPVVRAYEAPLTVVHFDAHLDYQPFVHGIVHSYGNPMRMVQQLDHVTKIVQVGIRSFRTQESDVDDSVAAGNVIVTTKALVERGPESFLGHLDPDSPVYVSIDIDVLDIGLVPGTGTPEPAGLSYRQLRDALAALARQCEVVGFDLVEVNPMLDLPNQATSFTGAQLIIEFLARCVEHPVYLRHHSRGRA